MLKKFESLNGLRLLNAVGCDVTCMLMISLSQGDVWSDVIEIERFMSVLCQEAIRKCKFRRVPLFHWPWHLGPKSILADN